MPLNHGLTVCWSDDATSVKWSTISERTCEEISSCSTVRSCIADGVIGSNRVRLTASAIAHAVAAPLANQPQPPTRRAGRSASARVLRLARSERVRCLGAV